MTLIGESFKRNQLPAIWTSRDFRLLIQIRVVFVVILWWTNYSGHDLLLFCEINPRERSSSETSADFQRTTRHYISEDRTFPSCTYEVPVQTSIGALADLNEHFVSLIRPSWQTVGQ
jgi:hypothetical protein